MARKRAGFGSVEQLPSGKWRAWYRVDGRRMEAPMTFDSVTDARLFRDSVRTDLTRGAWKAPRRAGYSVDEYGSRWITQRLGLIASTQAEYASTWSNHIRPYLGHLRLDKVTPELVRAWHAQTLQRLADELAQRRAEQLDREQAAAAKAATAGRTRTPKPPSAATVRDGSATAARAYRLLRSVFQTAVEDELLSANPCRVKGAGSTKPAERPVLSLPEVVDLTATVPEHYAALVQLLVWTGVRIGEAAALQRRDLHLDGERPTLTVRERIYRVEGVYDIDTPKSRVGMRTVALPKLLIPVLQDHLERYTDEKPSALVFTTNTGGVITNSYSQMMRKALNAIGRSDVRAHDLRHTGMTLAAEAGASLAVLKHRLGQSTTAAAELYLHATTDHGRRVSDRMDELAAEQHNVVSIHRRKRPVNH